MSGRDWVRTNLFRRGALAEGDEPAAGGERRDGIEPDLRAWIAGLRLGEPWRAGELTMRPLIGGHAVPGPFLSSREAIERGQLEVLEVGAGVVGELLARNRGRIPVLVAEGETLVGCKQNRVVAHSVLVAPGGTSRIPVGCMERGRWTSAAGTFRSGGLAMEPELRKTSLAAKVASRERGQRPALDQGALWRDVERSLGRSGVFSASSDYHALIRDREESVRSAMRDVRIVENEVGVLVERGGRLVGLEVLGLPEAWAASARRVLGAFLLAAREARGTERPGDTPGSTGDGAAARRLLDALASARVDLRPALGLGRDFDLRTPEVVGSGLWYEGAPAHLAAFGR